jgi:folate-binding Fe-S cluster repair protein YgfZ
MPAALLDDFSLLRFSGPDTQAFLHGQLTCDVQALNPRTSTYGGYCTPKGRLLATFLLWRDDDGYMMMAINHRRAGAQTAGDVYPARQS